MAMRLGVLVPTRGVVMQSARRPPVDECWTMARLADNAGYDAVRWASAPPTWCSRRLDGMLRPGSATSVSGSWATISSPSWSGSRPRFYRAYEKEERSMKVRFDPAAPYEVEEGDVPFARPEGKELQAGVYRPKGEPVAPLAALVDVHGGAWSRGDRTTGAHHGRALAASGLLVISLDFRQGSEHKHPAASADVAAGVRYVRAHAGRLGGDPR